MTKEQRAELLLVQIKAVREHRGGSIELYTLVNEVFRDAELLAEDVLCPANPYKHPISLD